ncbi:MAG: hypothetical protein ACE5K8_02300 [Candidatus Zixiibacteriota bacterium]
MSGQKRKRIIYLALVVTIIWGVYNFPSSRVKKNTVKLPETIQPLSNAQSVTSAKDMINIDEKTQASWGTDPFQSPKPVKIAFRRKPSWHLSGIVYNDHTPLAIINNQPVKVGHEIDDAKVVDIGERTVTLEYKGRLFRLSVTKG